MHPAERNKPALRADCVPYFEAFRLLGASRTWSQVGPNPILLSEIESHLRTEGIDDPYEVPKYKRLIKLLDRVEMDFLFEKSKKASK